MNALKKALLRLAGYIIEPKLPNPPSAEQPRAGVLFGYDPPEGTYFDVYFYDSTNMGSWHVVLKDKITDRHITSSCSLKKKYIAQRSGVRLSSGVRLTSTPDKQCIIEAVKEVLQQYDHIQSKKNLVGQYPPKRTP